jgi:hypothetical protein
MVLYNGSVREKLIFFDARFFINIRNERTDKKVGRFISPPPKLRLSGTSGPVLISDKANAIRARVNFSSLVSNLKALNISSALFDV